MAEIYQPEKDSYLLSQVLEKEIPILLKTNPDLTFLEIGCGSGIQLQTVLKAGLKKQNIFSCDINKKAVEYCKNLGFNSTQSNLFENIKGKYGIIIFNPPYLPEDKNKDEPEDSQLATTGGKKGSEILNKFLEQVSNYSKKNTKIYILTSSLTHDIDFQKFNKELIAKEKIFYEELYVLKLKENTLF